MMPLAARYAADPTFDVDDAVGSWIRSIGGDHVRFMSQRQIGQVVADWLAQRAGLNRARRRALRFNRDLPTVQNRTVERPDATSPPDDTVHSLTAAPSAPPFALTGI